MRQAAVASQAITCCVNLSRASCPVTEAIGGYMDAISGEMWCSRSQQAFSTSPCRAVSKQLTGVQV